ncbi:MAG: polysaccharide biosynthesis tyrosine autokinase [Planctomycetota bacterium]
MPRAFTPTPPSAAPVKSVLEIGQRRFWFVLAGLVVTLAAAAAQITRSPKLYRATATLVIDRPAATDLGIPGLYRDLQEATRFAATQREILASKTLLWELERRLELREWPEFAGLRDDDLVAALGSRLEIEPRGQSALVEVSFTSADRERVAEVVNTLCEIYLAHVATSGKQEVMRNLMAIDAELPRLRESRDAARRELEDFKSENSELTFAGRKELLQEELKQQSRLLQEARDEHDDLVSKKTVVEPCLEDGESVAAIAATLDVPVVAEYARKILELETRRAELAGREGARQAELAAFDEHARQLRDAMAAEQRRAVDALLLQWEMSRLKLEQTERHQQELERLAAEIDRLETKHESLTVRLKDATDLYERLLHRREELLVLQAGVGSNERVWIQDAATPPQRPCSPRVALSLALASLLGLILGFTAAIVRDRLDDRLTVARDVEAALEVTPIASIPLVRTPQRVNPQLDWVNGTESFPADDFRKLLFSIEEIGPLPGRVIAVLSAMPREGKTTISMGLAIAAARAGYSTLLVDGDLKRPRLDELFGITEARGLIELLAGEVVLGEVAHRQPNHGLSVLPAGVPGPDIERLAQPENIRSFLELARRDYQVVLVDTMPMLLSSDALVFARFADERLLVASASNSRVEPTRQALAQLKHAGLCVRGTVLNRFVKPGDRYGHYGYGYRNPTEPGAGPATSSRTRSESSREVPPPEERSAS